MHSHNPTDPIVVPASLQATTPAEPEPATPDELANALGYDAIRNALRRHGHDGRRGGGTFWGPYLQAAAKAGRSPYGLNRKGRRTGAALQRHATSKARRLVHEGKMELTSKAQRFGTEGNVLQRSQASFDRAVRTGRASFALAT